MKRIGIFIISALFLAGCSSVNDALEPRMDLAALTTDPGYTGEEVGGTEGPIEFPDTSNEENKDAGWAYVELVQARLGEVDLKFVQPRNFLACFEYRVDDEPNTVPGDNPNEDVTDGRWTQVCVTSNETQQDEYGFDSETTLTIAADEYVDVRLLYGAEDKERFDWTRFYPLTIESKDECKDGAWEALGFKNQGQCIASVVANSNSVH